MWYRIELNKDGSVASCAEVEACAVEGRNIRYVEAGTRAEALGLVARWYRDRARKNADRHRYEAAALAKGLCCSCKKAPLANASRCADCADRKNSRGREIRSGAQPIYKFARTDAERAELMHRQRERDRARTTARGARALARDPLKAERLALEKTLHAFDTMPADAFRAWLVGQIQERAPKQRGAFSVLRATLDQHPADAE